MGFMRHAPFFGDNRGTWTQKWFIQVGDAFSDIYTFTAYENEMGELFLAEWLFDMGYLFFFRVCSVCSGYAQSYLEKTNEV